MYNAALTGYEKALGPEHTSTLNTVNNLGNLYHKQGRLKDAEIIYNRALAGFEKLRTRPRSTPSTASVSFTKSKAFTKDAVKMCFVNLWKDAAHYLKKFPKHEISSNACRTEVTRGAECK